MKRVLEIIVLFFLLTATLPSFLLRADDAGNNHCLRCHGMQTLAYRDSLTGGLVNLYVDSAKFAHSNHAQLKCLQCHDTNFKTFPHPAQALQQKLTCTDCHKDEQRFASFHFDEKEKEFKQSVHYQKFGDKFSCFSCHDPHAFKDMRGVKNIKEVVKKDNAVCLSCHNSQTQLSKLSVAPYHDLLTAHNWLPKPQLHWRSVRCVECHTPQNDFNSHKIMPAKQAVKKCETCHNQNSILFAKLYRFKTTESRQKIGFLKTLAYNYPYVIGMTRIPAIDQISVIIFILMLLGLGAHAFGRWLAHRRNIK